MPGGSKEHNRDLAAVALASGKTGADAAVAAGVCERTVRNWLRKPKFRARVRELRDQVVSRAAAMLADRMAEAATVLADLMKSEDEDVKHKAAVKVIELGVKVTEITDLQERVAELERNRAQPANPDNSTGGPEPEEFDLDGEREPSGEVPDGPDTAHA